METRHAVRESFAARAHELEHQLDEIAERTPHPSKDAENRLNDLRARLADLGLRLREKEEADARDQDAALVTLGRVVGDLAADVASWPNEPSGRSR